MNVRSIAVYSGSYSRASRNLKHYVHYVHSPRAIFASSAKHTLLLLWSTTVGSHDESSPLSPVLHEVD